MSVSEDAEKWTSRIQVIFKLMDNACFFFLYKITVFSSKGKFINSATSNFRSYRTHRLYPDIYNFSTCFFTYAVCCVPALSLTAFTRSIVIYSSVSSCIPVPPFILIWQNHIAGSWTSCYAASQLRFSLHNTQKGHLLNFFRKWPCEPKNQYAIAFEHLKHFWLLPVERG